MARNLYGTVMAEADWLDGMAHYITQCREALGRLPTEQVESGDLLFATLR